MKIKNILKSVCAVSLAACILMGCALLNVGAATVNTDTTTGERYGDFSYSKNGKGTISITRYLGSDTNVVIPSEIEGIPVTSIAVYAFMDYTELTSVTIPDSITYIGGSAFLRCTGLTSVTIPDGVTEIGNWAFYGCLGLTGIEVGENNETYSSQDGVLFNKEKTILIQCPAAKIGPFAIPDTVTEVGEYAFYGCSELTSMIIPNSVTSIDLGSFYGCSGLTNVTIGDSVRTIDFEAFAYCSSLTSVTIPDSVVNMGKAKRGTGELDYCGVFEGCTGLTSIIIPDSVKEIDGAAFSYCESLTIYGYKDSSAEHIAKLCGIPFVALDDTDEGMIGDISGDGIIDVTDATLVQMSIANLTELSDEERANADVNSDGKVDVEDATLIQMFAANLIDSFE